MAVPYQRILVIGSGGVGTIAGYNLEQSGGATVVMALRSNFEAASKDSFTIESCDRGYVTGWKLSEDL
ncbi:hypothetical protein NKR23_g896 [Pleurostoma richardsiae]|uniref:Ketopantoate reductase N-terminal domain-containing protein n=1 Tax=Pleurostoma richardsiae TaxID=41990 RepID=A0AA38RTN7_9PEZI|nr:hypothetical protein NKR23_g896 [Pleurostoma richardsiae]